MKSHVSMLLEVASCLISDVAARCSAKESAHRDTLTLVSRVKDEGLSFLTITLPTYGQDFERCLDLGFVDSRYFRSFKKYREIPAFLRGILSQVFDADTGRILNDPSIEAIKGIRQIAYCFKKLKLACSPRRINKTFTGYIQDERDLQTPVPDHERVFFTNLSRLLWDWIVGDDSLRPLSLLPKHGPGATAERISGNGKYVFRRWHNRLEPYFPCDSNAFATLSALESKEFDELTIVSEDQEQPVRVITVPKTLKSPRIIAIEPVCMQYTQQAISRALVRELEGSEIASGHVNFSDQKINQDLAIMSSQNGRLATIDLSSASDRVYSSLVYDMLSTAPDFRDAVFACRSRTAQLPNGHIVHLNKFASMGSALCFPIESMYFYTICVAARLRFHDLPLTYLNAFGCSREVYVYGDDILVPANEAEFITDYLHKFQCKVNMSKSFWTGKFRESCGMDAYDGVRVTPTYLRSMPPSDKRCASEIVSWVKTANQLQNAGYYQCSSYLYSVVERIVGKLPTVHETSPCLGRVPFADEFTIDRWNARLQRPEVWGLVAAPIYRKDKLDGYPALLKCLLSLEERSLSKRPTSMDREHLNRTARHGAVALKRRWSPPY